MSACTNNDNTISMCANCGKGEESSGKLKSCACNMVKYCNRDCQMAHRSQHKKECKKRVAEFYEMALFKTITDDDLFKHPPETEECPICFLPQPYLETGKRYNTCCGKYLCNGCIHAVFMDIDDPAEKCPFCRVLEPTSDEEVIQRVNKRVELGDANAIHNLGCFYSEGSYLPRNKAKALELWQRAAKLGCALCYWHGVYGWRWCGKEHYEGYTLLGASSYWRSFVI